MHRSKARPTARKQAAAKEGESVPDVYLTWAVLGVMATEAARKISNLRAFNRRTGLDSHPRLIGAFGAAEANNHFQS